MIINWYLCWHLIEVLSDQGGRITSFLIKIYQSVWEDNMESKSPDWMMTLLSGIFQDFSYSMKVNKDQNFKEETAIIFECILLELWSLSQPWYKGEPNLILPQGLEENIKLSCHIMKIPWAKLDNYRNIEEVMNNLSSNKEFSFVGNKIFLQISYCILTSHWKFLVNETKTISEINIPLLLSKNQSIKSQIKNWISLLSSELQKFEVEINNFSFQSHLGQIKNLNNLLTKNYNEKVFSVEKLQLKYYFDFLNTVLIPIWKFYGMGEEQLNCSLMKFWFLIIICEESRRNPNNLMAHLAEVAEIYLRLSKCSTQMQNNYSNCISFLKNYIKRNKWNLFEDPDLLEILQQIELSEIYKEEIYDYVANIAYTHLEQRKSKIRTAAETFRSAQAMKIQVGFDCLTSDEKWDSDWNLNDHVQ